MPGSFRNAGDGVYLARLADAGVKATTISRRLTAIADAHPFPAANS
jgi:replication-associated recombination protein RarA